MKIRLSLVMWKSPARRSFGGVARSRSPTSIVGGTTSSVRLFPLATLIRPEFRRPARLASATWITSPGMQFRASSPTSNVTISVSRFSL